MARCIRLRIFIAAESNHGNPDSPLHMFFRTATVNLLHDPLQPKASAAICYGCCACSSHRLHQSHLFFFAFSWLKFIHVFLRTKRQPRFPRSPDARFAKSPNRLTNTAWLFPLWRNMCSDAYGRPFVFLFQDGFVATKSQR